jgi:hypothetical protein
VLELRTTTFAAVSVESCPIKLTATFAAKFPPLTTVVSSMLGKELVTTELRKAPATATSPVEDGEVRTPWWVNRIVSLFAAPRTTTSEKSAVTSATSVFVYPA